MIGDEYNKLVRLRETAFQNMCKINELNEQGQRDEGLNNEAARAFQLYFKKLEKLNPTLGDKPEYKKALNILDKTIKNLNLFINKQPNTLFEVMQHFSQI